MSDSPLDPPPVISTQDLPARTLAYVRNVGPYMGDSALFGRLFGQVVAVLQPKGLIGPNSEAMSVYHDDPKTVVQEEERISVGFTVPADASIEATTESPIETMQLPAGPYLVGQFELNPTQYGAAWAAVMAHMCEQGLPPGEGAPYESYKNEPSQHPQGKHLVHICIPLAPPAPEG